MALNQKMILHQMSDDSRYFLFEDRGKTRLTVYSLDTEAINIKGLEFEYLYDVPWQTSEAITGEIIVNAQEEQGSSVTLIDTFEEISQAISQGIIQLTIDNDANVTLIHCKMPEVITDPTE